MKKKSKMAKNSRGIVHIFALTIMALVVVGGIGYFALKNRQLTLTPSPTSPPEPTVNQVPDDDLANWKTFSSQIVPIEFETPPDWGVEEEKIVGAYDHITVTASSPD